MVDMWDVRMPVSRCVKKWMAGLLGVYACHLLEDMSDLKGGEELMEVAPLYSISVKSGVFKPVMGS